MDYLLAGSYLQHKNNKNMEQRLDDLNKGKWVVGETKQYQGYIS